MSEYWNDGSSLYHHGIPGMKWGVKNGPPYPLSVEQKSNKEQRSLYQDKAYKKRKEKAISIGQKALGKYKKLDDKYGNRLTKELESTNPNYRKLSNIESEYHKKLDRKVTKFLENHGYEVISYGGGSDGDRSIQFGKEKPEKEWVDNGSYYTDVMKESWMIKTSYDDIIDMLID